MPVCGTRSPRIAIYIVGTWSGTGGLSISRISHTATLLGNGNVLVTGGNGLSGYVSSSELFDPTAGIGSFACHDVDCGM